MKNHKFSFIPLGSDNPHEIPLLIGGGFGTMELEMTFPSYWECNFIPTDFHSMIFQRGRLKPNSATKQITISDHS